MIDDKRYVLWLDDIAWLRGRPIMHERDLPLLRMKEQETAEFEHAYPEEAASLRAKMKEKELAA